MSYLCHFKLDMKQIKLMLIIYGCLTPKNVKVSFDFTFEKTTPKKVFDSSLVPFMTLARSLELLSFPMRSSVTIIVT